MDTPQKKKRIDYYPPGIHSHTSEKKERENSWPKGKSTGGGGLQGSIRHKEGDSENRMTLGKHVLRWSSEKGHR